MCRIGRVRRRRGQCVGMWVCLPHSYRARGEGRSRFLALSLSLLSASLRCSAARLGLALRAGCMRLQCGTNADRRGGSVLGALRRDGGETCSLLRGRRVCAWRLRPWLCAARLLFEGRGRMALIWVQSPHIEPAGAQVRGARARMWCARRAADSRLAGVFVRVCVANF
jgi:hypothetical protein